MNEIALHKHRDDVGSRMGFWLFLFSELILFGGMFIVYAVYRFKHPDEFRLAASELDSFTGTVNTMILLTSSLTIAMSITSLQRNKRRLSLFLVVMTVLLGLVFLINKYFEWAHKFSIGLYPQSPVLDSKPQGEILYFGLYYVMTGLHGLHVIIGMGILVFMSVFIYKGIINENSYVRLEVGALYWHLVDIIWIFLFPLFYLIH
jgi:cytochrome c oxidase subunit III